MRRRNASKGRGEAVWSCKAGEFGSGRAEELQKLSVAPLWPKTPSLPPSGCTRLSTHFQEGSPEPALLAEHTKGFIPVGIAETLALTTAAKAT